MTRTNDTTNEANSKTIDKESTTLFLDRLSEVTSREYPFPTPAKIKPGGRHERVDLTSRKNLGPVLMSIVRFMLSTTSPFLSMFFLFVYCFYCDGRSSGVTDDDAHYANWMNLWLSLGLGFGLRAMYVPNVFLLHFITNGRLGGLGPSSSSASEANSERGTHNDHVDDRTGNRFYCRRNAMNQRITKSLRSYLSYRPTPYLPSGDILTLHPFLFFKGSKGGRVPYERWWVRVPVAPAPDGDHPMEGLCTNGRLTEPKSDDEAVALDISFPSSPSTGRRCHDPNRPFFLILHGLNGGSSEPYVLDLVRRANREGCTAAVMINRGLMKTPLRGEHSFTGARTTDVGCAVRALHYAMADPSTYHDEKDNDNDKIRSNIILVGFSMGGIIAANYAAKTSSRSYVAAVLSFSGNLCNGPMFNVSSPAIRHSLAVWQPALTWALKATIVKRNLPIIYRKTSGLIDSQKVESIRTVLDIDRELVTPVHGYGTVDRYYEDMAAAGIGGVAGREKLGGIETPTLVVHSMDDPIAPFPVAGVEDVVEASERVVVLATVHGGHIGWPVGWFPAEGRWGFMVGLAMDYGELVVGTEVEDE